MAIILVVLVVGAGLGYEFYLSLPVSAVNNTSGFWSGYVVEAPKGAVTNVTGSWVVPAVVCGKGDANNLLLWVGIDGWNGTTSEQTVEQIGTRTDCLHGNAVYYAWYEFVPPGNASGNTTRLDNITIAPGDRVRTSVSGNPLSKSFLMTITDLRTGISSHAEGVLPAALLTTADWIAEAPRVGGTPFTMSNFNSVTFASNMATVLGQSKALNTFPDHGLVNASRITYLCPDNQAKAIPSSMTNGDDSFKVMWGAGGNC